MSEQPDGTIEDALTTDLNSIVNSVVESDDISTNVDELHLLHLETEATIMHTSASPVEALSDNNNMNSGELESTRQDGSVYLDDCEEAQASQPSRFRTNSGRFSTEGPVSTESEEHPTKMLLRGIPNVVDSEDEPPSSFESEPFYSRFRNSGPDLMTRHVFTGNFKGKNPIYIPVYKRNEAGQLLKLRKDSYRGWQYKESEKLSEDEIEAGLKILEKPESAEKRRRVLEVLGMK